MNKRFLDELQQEEDEYNAMYMDYEQFESSFEMPAATVCAFSSKVEKLALGVWDPQAYAHLSVCKYCNVQYAMSKLEAPSITKQAFVAKSIASTLKDAIFTLPNPIKIGFSFGVPSLAMGSESDSLSRIPLPKDKGSLCLKTNSEDLCQAWPEPSSLSFELLTLKGNAVLSRVFYKPSLPIPSFSLSGAEKLQVKFDSFQLEIDLAK
ncbi:MAG: hypothetical protein LBT59_04910 [Clostridiales bacterium]|jgi:hypothetical protein|nr:hypothetical protein [Clostridiales bacterium]